MILFEHINKRELNCLPFFLISYSSTTQSTHRVRISLFYISYWIRSVPLVSLKVMMAIGILICHIYPRILGILAASLTYHIYF